LNLKFGMVTAIKTPPEPAPPATGLDQLGPGCQAVIRLVGGEVGVRRRLLEMGFVSGTPLRVVRLAPLGDPMQIELHGYHISLRRSEARAILVQPA
jgi:Fe2+ transport system protein FeoA